MARFFWICFAGAIGTGLRYLVSQGAARAFGVGFPYGTLIVNLVGCFLIAAISQLALTGTLVSPAMRVVLTTGFVGGLTTYSAFNYETTRLLEDRTALGLLNFGLTVLGCLAAGLLGAVAVRRLSGP
jgi:fluoride exporter